MFDLFRRAPTDEFVLYPSVGDLSAGGGGTERRTRRHQIAVVSHRRAPAQAHPHPLIREALHKNLRFVMLSRREASGGGTHCWVRSLLRKLPSTVPDSSSLMFLGMTFCASPSEV